jgi:hypothetical protein
LKLETLQYFHAGVFASRSVPLLAEPVPSGLQVLEHILAARDLAPPAMGLVGHPLLVLGSDHLNFFPAEQLLFFQVLAHPLSPLS